MGKDTGKLKQIIIYTDGACIGNPGPGGYGIVLLYGKQRSDLAGGCRRTTNNRMEILAAIVGLEELKEKCRVTVYSDSQYLVKAIEQGWARKWKANGWRRNKKERALNPDLWERLLDLCDYHIVEFRWVKGHAGDAENERCDQLATEAAHRLDLRADEEYEALSARRPGLASTRYEIQHSKSGA